ncbi:collagen EMF1-alpha precursor, partial [Aspergillus arachidicola]
MKAATLLSLLSVAGLVAAAPAGNGPAGGIIDRDLPVDLPTKDLPIGGLAGGSKGGEKPGNKVTAREDPNGSTPDGKGNGAGGDLTGLPGQGGLESPVDLPTPELSPVKLPDGPDGGKGGLGLGRRASPVDGLPVVGDVAGGLLGGAKGDTKGGAGNGAGAQ